MEERADAVRGESQDLAEFESDFTWDDVSVADDAESLFFGSAKED